MSRRSLTTAILYLLLAALAFCFALPFVWMLESSVKTTEQIFTMPPVWVPYPVYEQVPESRWRERSPAEYQQSPLYRKGPAGGYRKMEYEDYVRSLEAARKPHERERGDVLYRRVPAREYFRAVLLANYQGAMTLVPFLRYLLNTLFVCAGCILGNLLSASLVAYSLAILKWRGRDLSFKVLLATMLLPPQVTMIPVFVIYRYLGMVDTFWPLILPAFLGSPFFIFLLRQFFLGIPGELTEAARIDGCNEWGIYWRIILPLALPSLATVSLFAFIWSWTDFLTPLIYLQDQARFTLSIGLQQFQESHSAEWGMLMAASTLMTFPIILLFFFTQKTFVQGIQTTGLKG